MKKIVVNQNQCIGCGACVAIAPENFEFDENGKSSVLSQENIESENVLNAVESCPTSAISVEELTHEEQEEICKTCEDENCECDDCECSECEHHHCEEEN